ncbi:MAG: hypothetical protein ACREMY_32065 [bacterium]
MPYDVDNPLRCPNGYCGSDFVNPADDGREDLERGGWFIHVFCGECRWNDVVYFTQKQVERYDDLLMAEGDEVFHMLVRRERENFKEWGSALRSALQGSIGPEDFRRPEP